MTPTLWFINLKADPAKSLQSPALSPSPPFERISQTFKERSLNMRVALRGLARYARLRFRERQRLSYVASHDSSLIEVPRDIGLLRNKVRVMKGSPPNQRRRAVIRTLNSLTRELRRRRFRLLCLRLAGPRRHSKGASDGWLCCPRSRRHHAARSCLIRTQLELRPANDGEAA